MVRRLQGSGMRPGTDEYFVAMALMSATKGSCVRRRVGCILVNARKHILATGYNGPASGEPNCVEVLCGGALLPSGTGLDQCEAIHAEQNALIQCDRVHEIETVYCTTAPCTSCIKMIMNTGAKRIVFWEDYPHAEVSKQRWLAHCRRKYDRVGEDSDFWVAFPRPDLTQSWDGKSNILAHVAAAALSTYVQVSQGILKQAKDKVAEQNVPERGPTPAVRPRVDVGTTETRRMARSQKRRPDSG